MSTRHGTNDTTRDVQTCHIHALMFVNTMYIDLVVHTNARCRAQQETTRSDITRAPSAGTNLRCERATDSFAQGVYVYDCSLTLQATGAARTRSGSTKKSAPMLVALSTAVSLGLRWACTQ
jgi:hypothetical protein